MSLHHTTGTNVHPARSHLPSGTGLLARIAETSGGNGADTKLKGAQFQDSDRDKIEQAALAAFEECNIVFSESTWLRFCPALVSELQKRIPGLCPQGGPKRENHDANT